MMPATGQGPNGATTATEGSTGGVANKNKKNKSCQPHLHDADPRAFGKRSGRLYHYIGGAMSAQHRDAQKATQESKGIEKSEEAAGVAGAKIGIEPERHALQQIA